MNVQPSTSQERRLIFIETLLDETDAISKVSPNSALSGVASGVAKVAGKCEKDIILALSELFPDVSFGSQLDRVGQNLGITARLGALGSSTYVRVTADPGTVYAQGTQNFISTEGPQFTLDESVTVGVAGFAYAKVSSVDQGSRTNVGPLTISKVTPQPSGHQAVINEYKADGGRDIETDEQLRIRIQDGGNILARGTVAMIEQLCISQNPKVLKAYNYGVDLNGKRVIALSTQNGSDLTTNELQTLTTFIGPYCGLSDARWNGVNYSGLLLKNIEYQPIDTSFRVILDDTANPDDVRQAIQVGYSKYLDFRTFDPTKSVVEWDNLLEIVKSTEGVKYVPDQYFYPRNDVAVSAYKLPRLRGFLMLDINGNVISNQSGTLSPVYYPNVADFSYISTVLQAL